jgi:uncharacterized protein
MKILIDIGHPGHVHYFKNLIIGLQDNNHQVIVTARNRGIIFSLLKKNNIKYYNRGKGGRSRFFKLCYMLYADLFILQLSLRKKVDLLVSFSSPYAAQSAALINKPHIAINDTEHTDGIHAKFTYPFSKAIITPEVYQNNLGCKQIKFGNIVEGLYLHDNYFNPNPGVLNDLKLAPGQKFIVIRFVSWEAHHDYGHSGLDTGTVIKLIDILSTNYKIFISSELELPDKLKKYEINIHPEKMHDVLFYASLFIGESATMASESAYLGTLAIYVNSLPLMGYLSLEEKFGLLKRFKSSDGVIDYVHKLLCMGSHKIEAKNASLEMKKGFIDPTKFLLWLIDGYPDSLNIIRSNPDYQKRFK